MRFFWLTDGGALNVEAIEVVRPLDDMSYRKFRVTFASGMEIILPSDDGKKLQRVIMQYEHEDRQKKRDEQ